MKILMVNKFLYPRGGAESYMLKVGKYFEDHGDEVQYFGMYHEKNTVGNKAGQYTSLMDFHKNSIEVVTYPFRILYSKEAKKKIGKVIDDFKPDVVHLNNINFQLTPSIIDAAKDRGVPVVWTVHDYQMVCPNHLLYDFKKEVTCERCIAGDKYNCVKYKCIHGSLAKSIMGYMESRLYDKRGTYNKIDCFVCPSYFLESKLMKDAPEIYKGKTKVIHNFVEKETEKKTYTSRFDFPYIAFAGRLSAEKGIRVLAEAAKLLPDVHFVVMGNGPEEAVLHDIPNVTLTGFVTGDELKGNIACAEAIAVPSVCLENCPLSILEGQAFGVPAITMNMGGMAELVAEGETGMLSPTPTGKDFAETIRKYLSDPEKIKKMKANCLEVSKTFIGLDDYCAQIQDIYDEVRKK